MIYFILFYVIALPKSAFAYLDPGTGSLLFQFFLATFVGASFAVKMYWQKIRLFVAHIFAKKKEGDVHDEQ
ncbi:MAG TPA: hypothetical protein VJH21_01895 [Candidatus Paceibacterota bacterium]